MHVWIALSSGTTYVFCSTQRTQPLAFASSWTAYRRLGVVSWYDGALVPFTQRGGENTRRYVLEVGLSAANTAVSASGATSWTRLVMNTVMPQTASGVLFTMNFTAAGVGDDVFWRTSGVGSSTVTRADLLYATGITMIIPGQDCTLDAFQAIDYVTSNASDGPLFRIKELH